jgi:hypothetical protein
MLLADFLLDVLFHPEDGGDAFHRNVGGLKPEYTTLVGMLLMLSPGTVMNIS